MAKNFHCAVIGIVVLAFLTCGCGSAQKDLTERYPKTFSLLGTELTEPGAVQKLNKSESEYNEMTNQTAWKLDLANGGSLWLNNKIEIVEIDNFGGTGGADSLEDAIAALEAEFGLEGFIYGTRELGTDGVCALYWEKQVGEYCNPYDSLRVILNEETFGLESLTRYNFPAETSEPAITEAEALEKAAPYLGANQYDRMKVTCQRTNLKAGTSELPEYGTTARLVYVFYRERARVSIDAVTGELTDYDEAAAAES